MVEYARNKLDVGVVGSKPILRSSQYRSTAAKTSFNTVRIVECRTIEAETCVVCALQELLEIEVLQQVPIVEITGEAQVVVSLQQ